jgi:hypothetical protein
MMMLEALLDIKLALLNSSSYRVDLLLNGADISLYELISHSLPPIVERSLHHIEAEEQSDLMRLL